MVGVVVYLVVLNQVLLAQAREDDAVLAIIVHLVATHLKLGGSIVRVEAIHCIGVDFTIFNLDPNGFERVHAEVVVVDLAVED